MTTAEEDVVPATKLLEVVVVIRPAVELLVVTSGAGDEVAETVEDDEVSKAVVYSSRAELDS